MTQPHGVKKDFFWSVVTAAATALAVRVAEMAFDKVRERVEESQQSTKPKRKKAKK